jgi:UDP-GlcNAc3NAcA epimerase
MSACFFSDLGLEEPRINLNVGSGSHGIQTGRMLAGLEEVLLREPSDWVLLYGDTNSTLAGALATAKLRRATAHIEAGVRSFDRGMPEEINRILTDRVCDLLFAPTETAVANLRAEGVNEGQIELVGDVMYDATLLYHTRIVQSPILRSLRVRAKGFGLVTFHRAENTDDPARLATIANALCELAQEIPVVLPLHPRTRAALERAERLEMLQSMAPALLLTQPVGYFEMSALERGARFILTDSGGVQKEAYFHGTPCLILRDVTEWPELVRCGASTLCPPTSVRAVVDAARRLNSESLTPATHFGMGDAANRIVTALTNGRSGPLR